MMSRTNTAILIVSIVIGLTAFMLTRTTHGQPAATGQRRVDERPRWGRIDAMARWLGLSQQQRDVIETQDPTFWQDVIGQRERLAGERDRLARLLEDPTATDQQITAQVEGMIVLGNEVERRVAKHLLVVRKVLTPEQQKQLFGLAATRVREHMGWCGNWPDRSPGKGQGRGWGRGGGRGRGGQGMEPGRGRGQGRPGMGPGGDRGPGRAQGGRGYGQGGGRGAGQGRGPNECPNELDH
jgi:Spy/CpxP family protein refolding chaperone